MKNKIWTILIITLMIGLTACVEETSDSVEYESSSSEEISISISNSESSNESSSNSVEISVPENDNNQSESVTSLNANDVDLEKFASLDCNFYVKETNAAYDLNGFTIVDDNSYVNLKSIGEFKIDATYEYLPAIFDSYYINSNSLTFYYKQTLPETIIDDEGYAYTILQDNTDKMMGHAIGDIQNGGFMVLKSYDRGTTWIYDNISYVNITDNIIKYTPKGEDINKGVLLKFISGLKVHCEKVVGQEKHWIFWPFKYEMVDIIEDNVFTYIQESTIYIESGIISAGFYSNEVDYKYEGENSDVGEIINKSSSLTDGSITFDQIKYSTNGNDHLTTKCSYNDGNWFEVKEGDVFSNLGQYKFRISNSVGTFKDVTIYILDKEKVFSDYFGMGLVEPEMRLFDASSNIPVYMKGTKINFSVKENMPAVYGNIYEIINGKVCEEPFKIINASNGTFHYGFENTGVFCVDLYLGKEESTGQKINYRFYFQIVNRPSYMPEINYTLLNSSDRFINMQRKAYAVNFVTTKGGAYVFLFPATLTGYDEAFDFGYNIEKRFIETYEENNKKYYYYRGIRYDSKVELYEQITQNVSANLYLTYINTLETYGVEVLPNEKLQQIENQVLDRDVRVCSSQKVKDELCSSDIIVNDFVFTQIADYECEKIVAIDEEGNEIFIPFDVNINSILNKSGKYLIREYNWCNVREYEINYIHLKDNTGMVSATIYKEDDTSESVNISNGSEVNLEAKRIVFNKSFDELDSQALVIITSVGYRKVCLLKELDTYVYDLKEKGNYHIEVINRLGNSFSFNVKISGSLVTEG